MRDRNLVTAGVVGAIAAAICCAAPMVAVTLGTAGPMAWLANGAYVLIPILVICLALIGLRFRRRRTAVASSSPATSGRVGKS
ncbi:MAG: mercury transport protein [Methylocella sp.]